MDFLISLFYVLVLVLVLVCAYVATRIFAMKSIQMTQGRYIRLVDRIVLGKDKSILIIQIGSNYYLLAESAQGFGIISNLEEADLIPLEKKQLPLNFQGIMEKYLNLGIRKSEGNADENLLDIIKNRISDNIKSLNKKNKGK